MPCASQARWAKVLIVQWQQRPQAHLRYDISYKPPMTFAAGRLLSVAILSWRHSSGTVGIDRLYWPFSRHSGDALRRSAAMRGRTATPIRANVTTLHDIQRDGIFSPPFAEHRHHKPHDVDASSNTMKLCRIDTGQIPVPNTYINSGD